MSKRMVALAAVVAFAGCIDDSGSAAVADGSPVPSQPDARDTAPNSPPAVELSLLTYNVAGLPEPLSGSNPADNTPLISPLLAAYELVVVQEDFAYHDQLAGEAGHPHQSEPYDTQGGTNLGDGLNRFSSSPFVDHVRQKWEECSGLIGGSNDCLTPKGFSVATHTVDGIEIDIYNLHMDAGRGSDDREARTDQLAQLVRWIDDHSGNRPVIIAGDTNLKGDEDEVVLVEFLAQTGIVDVCRALSCSEPARIDRILVRSSSEVEIEPKSWSVAEEFVDADGEPLSDHEAVQASLLIRGRR